MSLLSKLILGDYKILGTEFNKRGLKFGNFSLQLFLSRVVYFLAFCLFQGLLELDNLLCLCISLNCQLLYCCIFFVLSSSGGETDITYYANFKRFSSSLTELEPPAGEVGVGFASASLFVVSGGELAGEASPLLVPAFFSVKAFI